MCFLFTKKKTVSCALQPYIVRWNKVLNYQCENLLNCIQHQNRILVTYTATPNQVILVISTFRFLYYTAMRYPVHTVKWYTTIQEIKLPSDPSLVEGTQCKAYSLSSFQLANGLSNCLSTV